MTNQSGCRYATSPRPGQHPSTLHTGAGVACVVGAGKEGVGTEAAGRGFVAGSLEVQAAIARQETIVTQSRAMTARDVAAAPPASPTRPPHNADAPRIAQNDRLVFPLELIQLEHVDEVLPFNRTPVCPADVDVISVQRDR